MRTERIVMAWSGGKDCALALDRIRREGRYEVISLMTTVAGTDGRVSHHGVPTTLMIQQAESIGIPLHLLHLDLHAPGNTSYAMLMERTMRDYARQGVRAVAFGDIFLQSLREYREANLAQVGMEAIFPVWGVDTRHLAEEFVRREFKARLAAVDENRLDRSFAGRSFDRSLLNDLPPDVDPCGERGEFHTFVYDGPIFSRPVSVRIGRRSSHDGLHLVDLSPDDGSSAESTPIDSITQSK